MSHMRVFSKTATLMICDTLSNYEIKFSFCGNEKNCIRRFLHRWIITVRTLYLWRSYSLRNVRTSG